MTRKTIWTFQEVHKEHSTLMFSTKEYIKKPMSIEYKIVPSMKSKHTIQLFTRILAHVYDDGGSETMITDVLNTKVFV